ncbi:hypothetical protein L208DRAFT_1451181 [Tricholoma matsutake]|nr:hypothetical protein L208DRAFT_1451181 [Tricholoma matsutake 945]
MMLTTPLVLLALSAGTLASVFVTSPVASTTFTGGQPCNISWKDDGSSPSLALFGPAKVSIYAGNAQEQTLLQLIAPAANVSANSSISFVVDPKIGPNSNKYFIRFESLNEKDPKLPQYPALAFSAQFALNGMSGQFTPQVSSEIAGQSTAPLAGATSAPSQSGSATSTTTSRSSSSTTSARSTASSSSNGAVNIKAGWLGVLVGAAVGSAIF